MTRANLFAVTLLAALALPAAPAPAWDWSPPEGEPMLDIGGIERLPPPFGLIALAGLRRMVATAPVDADLTGLDHGVTLLDFLLFDTNRPVLLAALRALALDVARHRFGEMSAAYAEALIALRGPYGFEPLDYAAAEAPVRAGVEIMRQLANDPQSRHALVGHLGLLATVLSELGQHEEAVAIRREVLDYWRAQPDQHPMVLQPRIWGLAQTMAVAGDLDGAQVLFDEGLAILRTDSHGSPTVLVGPLREVAGLLDASDPQYAQTLRDEGRQILERHLQEGGAEDPYQRQGWMAVLADLLVEMGEIAEASALHLQAVALARHGLGDDHRLTRQSVAAALAHARALDPDNPDLVALARDYAQSIRAD